VFISSFRHVQAGRKLIWSNVTWHLFGMGLGEKIGFTRMAPWTQGTTSTEEFNWIVLQLSIVGLSHPLVSLPCRVEELAKLTSRCSNALERSCCRLSSARPKRQKYFITMKASLPALFSTEYPFPSSLSLSRARAVLSCVYTLSAPPTSHPLCKLLSGGCLRCACAYVREFLWRDIASRDNSGFKDWDYDGTVDRGD
jgi:hypothetical protein